MRWAILAGLCVAVGLPVAAWLARPGGGGVARAVAVTTTTAAPQQEPSREPPAPPQDALVLAGEAGPYAVALEVQAARLTAVVLSPAGGGAHGLDVRFLPSGAHGAPCGSGCYTAAARRGRLITVEIGARRISFALPAHPAPAAALVRRIRARYRALPGVAYVERLATGSGAATVTQWRLLPPDRFTYSIAGGPQAVVLGTRRWDRNSPHGRWTESPQIPRLPQPATLWQSATNAWLLAPDVVVFADPAIPAFFRLEFDPATLRPRFLRMTAASHFMTDRYVNFSPTPALRAPRRAAGG